MAIKVNRKLMDGDFDITPPLMSLMLFFFSKISSFAYSS